jgi:hypothetical protein
MTGLAIALAALSGSGDLEHRITLAHGGADMAAVYRANVSIETRQRGISPPNRQSTAQCHWQAMVSVDRVLEGPSGASPARAVASDRSIGGHRPGTCASARGAIEREVAERSPAVREHLIAVAEADRRNLVAELEATQPNG